MSRSVCILFANLGLTGFVLGDVLYDTSWVTDQLAYDDGLGNGYGGLAFGQLVDLRVADDMFIDSAVYPMGVVLTRVAQDSLAAIGDPPPREGFIVRVYEDAAGKPADVPALEIPVSLRHATISDFVDPLFGVAGRRFALDVSSYQIHLPPGVHWISIQPVDTAPDGDWWWQVWDRDTPIGGDAYRWDGDWGLWYSSGPGAVAMKIEGVAIPAPAAGVVLAFGLAPRRHRPSVALRNRRRA